ncbi:MAG: DUF1997 domain-containing protein [Synechococcus sp.]|nr:DUF1997 domain-containing protein [Synechococcus sp.]
MALAFQAAQSLDLPVNSGGADLPAYLQQEARVVGALLSADQLIELAPGHYRYSVRPLQLFQLRIHPTVDLAVQSTPGRMELNSIDCNLEGVPGLADDFRLTLRSWLQAQGDGLVGEAQLGVEVSQPSVLRLIPARVLESTGESLLNGILLTIKGRVGHQLVQDFQHWRRQLAA